MVHVFDESDPADVAGNLIWCRDANEAYTAANTFGYANVMTPAGRRK